MTSVTGNQSSRNRFTCTETLSRPIDLYFGPKAPAGKEAKGHTRSQTICGLVGDVVIRGTFVEIDEGSRARRMLISLVLERSEMRDTARAQSR